MYLLVRFFACMHTLVEIHKRFSPCYVLAIGAIKQLTLFFRHFESLGLALLNLLLFVQISVMLLEVLPISNMELYIQLLYIADSNDKPELTRILQRFAVKKFTGTKHTFCKMQGRKTQIVCTFVLSVTFSTCTIFMLTS